MTGTVCMWRTTGFVAIQPWDVGTAVDMGNAVNDMDNAVDNLNTGTSRRMIGTTSSFSYVAWCVAAYSGRRHGIYTPSVTVELGHRVNLATLLTKS